MFNTRVFRPVLMEEEGLDTSTFFGGQDVVDETTLPDANSPELLEQTPETGAVDQLPADADETDPTKAEQPAQGRKQYVPLAALQEERAARQAERDENRVLQERMNQFLQWQMQQAQQQQPQQPQEEQIQIPAFVDDPEGHINGLRAQVQRELDALRHQSAQQQQHVQVSAQQQQLAIEVNAAEATFRQAEPNYDAALNHFNAVKVAEYMAFGFSELQARQQLSRDYQGIALGAKQTNKNPAEVVFNIAKALGFKPAAPAAAPGNGAPPAGAPKKAPTSLSTLPAAGTAPDEKGPMSAKQVAQMSNEEFDKFFEEMARNSVQRPAF